MSDESRDQKYFCGRWRYEWNHRPAKVAAKKLVSTTDRIIDLIAKKLRCPDTQIQEAK